MTSIEVINEIIQVNSNIKRICFKEFDNYHSLQERTVLNENEQEILKLTMQIRNEYGISFMDALLISFLKKNYYLYIIKK